MYKLIRVVHSFIAGILIVLMTILAGIFFFPGWVFFKGTGYGDWFQHTWMNTLLNICGVKVTVEGLEKLEEGKKYVYMGNHQSLLDIPVTLTFLPGHVRMLAKKELFRIPLFGWAIGLMGHIPIDRQNRERAVRSIDETIERLKIDTISPMLYPEGTRSSDGRILPFKKGGFVLAIKSQMDIVPVTIIGTRKILPKKSFYLTPGKVKVIVGEPFPTIDYNYKQRGEVAEMIREVIVKNFSENTID